MRLARNVVEGGTFAAVHAVELAELILGHLAHGTTIEAIVKEFPTINEEDVRAVIAFAAASAAEDLPAPSPLRRTLTSREDQTG